MNLLYVSNSRIPTGRAHGVQIMHMCGAFAARGAEVRLVVPGKRNFLEEDPFEYYNIRAHFKIERIPVPDIGSKTVRLARGVFFFYVITFALALFFFPICSHRVGTRSPLRSMMCRGGPSSFSPP